MNSKELKKIIMEELQGALKEDAPGTSHAYGDLEYVLEELNNALKILNNPQGACIGWHDGVKKAGAHVKSALSTVQRMK